MAKIEVGKEQTLKVLRKADFGIYLGYEEEKDEAVLLPAKQVPENTEIGDAVSVFVYRDSEDRLISTTRKPYVKAGEFAYLTVKNTSRVGAFLDWGLEKDLFLPFKEQEEPVKGKDRLLVYVYVDKSGRLCATGRIYDYLKPSAKREFYPGDAFTGVVYRTEKDHGVFVAVVPKKRSVTRDMPESFDRLYYGLIPPSEAYRKYKIGEILQGRIIRIREDLKLDVTERKKIVDMIEKDGETILRKIEEYQGELPFSENASPEIIRRELSMSKAAFKRAAGHLLKQGKIRIEADRITKISQ